MKRKIKLWLLVIVGVFIFFIIIGVAFGSKPATPAPATPVAPAPTPVAPTQPAPTQAPAATQPAPSCFPLTDSGNCYEPGEFCRTADAGMTGVAGDGKTITCTDKHWE